MLVVPISPGLVRHLQATVDGFFLSDDYWGWSAKQYHALVADAQKSLRLADMAGRLADSVVGHLPASFTLGRLYLRAARPNVGGQESVGWHREEMYGSPKGTLNFWAPICGVTRENTIRYIPGSEHIPDDEIKLEQAPDATVAKGSNGNEIGLLYAPKHIVGGVDFTKAQPLEVPVGSAAIFSGSVIHGAAVNRGPDIRFSVDFRVYQR